MNQIPPSRSNGSHPLNVVLWCRRSNEECDAAVVHELMDFDWLLYHEHNRILWQNRLHKCRLFPQFVDLLYWVWNNDVYERSDLRTSLNQLNIHENAEQSKQVIFGAFIQIVATTLWNCVVESLKVDQHWWMASDESLEFFEIIFT